MMSVQLDVVVPAPIEDVFRRLVDLPAYAEWLEPSSASTGCRFTSSGPVGSGSTYEDRGALGTFEGEIVEFTRPMRVVFRQSLATFGRPMLLAVQANVLTPTPDGTRVDHAFEGTMLGPFRTLTPVIRIGVRREREGVLRALVHSFQ